MYFLEQIKSQFIAQLASYNNGPEGPSDAENTPVKAEGPKSPDEVKQDMEATGEEAHRTAEGMQARSNELAQGVAALEGGKDIEPLSSEETLSHMQTRPEEEANAREALGENATLEQIREHAFDARVEALQSNTITQGEREVIEAEFIAEIAAESEISPELIGGLRALGFEGSQDWAEGDVAANLESMTEDLQRMKEQIEADGGEFPKTKEEFMALYEAMNQNDSGNGDSHEMDPAAASANGVNVQRTEDGFQIDPTTPGYRQVGDMVVGPAGAPYSRGGQVFSGTGEISTAVNANLDASYTGLRTLERQPYSSDIQVSAENKEIIETRVPAEWHGSAAKLANKEGRIDNSKVICLASMQEKRAVVCYPDGKVDEFPIVIGAGGYREGMHSGGRTTPTYDTFHFDGNSKVTGRGVDASNGGSTTVLGASAQSPEGAASGGKWWHGVADNRIPGGATHGCIGGKQENMMMMTRAILQAGGGYGFHTNTKAG